MPAPTFPSRDLVGHHEILLDPVDRRGLRAASTFVVRECLALVTLLDGGVVVEGGGRALPLGGYLIHQGGGDAGQALEGGGLGRDVGHLAGRWAWAAAISCSSWQAGEEVAQGIRRGPRALHEAAEPAVSLEHGDVVAAVPARRKEQDQGLDLLDLGVSALARAEVDVLTDHPREPQGAHRLQHQGQAGPAGQPVEVRDRLDRVRQEAGAHRGADRAGAHRARGGALCRRARFTAVRSFTMVQSSA
jgi:hypothetical protein